MVGTTQLLLIFFIVLILFGAGKISKIMSEFGKGIKNLRKELKEDDKDEQK